ncbi:MAG: hypothetical protein HY874_09455 [Chloroflexi bacterium]|nr:hypothetical protein [Chloroflexota bacterium]
MRLSTKFSPGIAVMAAGALVACALAAAVACSGDGTTTTVSIVPVSSASPVAISGIPEVDHIINAAVAGDMIELAALTGYQRVACETEASDGSGAPPCREDESTGDEVEVLAASACERTWVRPELATQAYRSALGFGAASPVAVYKPADSSNTFEGGFGAQYVAVLSTGRRDDGSPAGVALHLTNGRITWLERDCTQLSELLGSDRVESFVVDPAAPPEDTATVPAAEPTAAP